MTISIASTSIEPIEVVITTDIDPSSSTVKAKFQTAGTAAPSTAASGWTAGTWQTPAVTGSRYTTPAWFTVSGLTVGTYDVWVWVDGATYDPVIKAASLQITG